LSLPPQYLGDALTTLTWVLPLQTAVFFRFGLYKGVWRFASLPDLKRIASAVLVTALLIPIILYLFRINAVVPRAVLLLDPLLLIIIMGGLRASRFWWLVQARQQIICSANCPIIQPAFMLWAC
jgi:FlaA1/EpsC-like NDP-sugar epimerase